MSLGILSLRSGAYVRYHSSMLPPIEMLDLSRCRCRIMVSFLQDVSPPAELIGPF